MVKYPHEVWCGDFGDTSRVLRVCGGAGGRAAAAVVAGVEEAHAYDAAGNPIYATRNAQSHSYGATDFELVVSNRYDHLGRRVQKVTPEATHTYFYDGWMLIGGTQEQTDIGGAHNGKMYLREDRGDA